jgi:hypothetical protein
MLIAYCHLPDQTVITGNWYLILMSVVAQTLFALIIRKGGVC